MKIKKKYIIIGIVFVFAIIVALGLWLFLPSGKTLARMNVTVPEIETSVYTTTFQANAGDEISYSSSITINNGSVAIMLYDSKGNFISEIDSSFTIDYPDTYTLAAEYKDYVGKFKVRIYK